MVRFESNDGDITDHSLRNLLLAATFLAAVPLLPLSAFKRAHSVKNDTFHLALPVSCHSLAILRISGNRFLTSTTSAPKLILLIHSSFSGFCTIPANHDEQGQHGYTTKHYSLDRDTFDPLEPVISDRRLVGSALQISTWTLHSA